MRLRFAKAAAALAMLVGSIAVYCSVSQLHHNRPDVSLNGYFLGQSPGEMEIREAELCGGLMPPTVQLDDSGRVSWIFGDGILVTPQGEVFSFPPEQIFQSRKILGPPDLVRNSGKTTCWSYRALNVKLYCGEGYAKVEIGTRHPGPYFTAISDPEGRTKLVPVELDLPVGSTKPTGLWFT